MCPAQEYIVLPYFYLLIFASIITGTAIAFFMTASMGNKYASIHRALAFVSLKMAWLYILSTFFWFYENWVVLLFLGYYLLFIRLYHTSYARALRFLFISTVFGIAARLIVAPRIADTLLGIAY